MNCSFTLARTCDIIKGCILLRVRSRLSVGLSVRQDPRSTLKADNMFQVRIDTIRERTTNGPTYMKGRQYYRQGQVKHLTFDQENGIILAQVEGTRMYTVRIILDSKGDLHDASCTCSAFAAYWGLCRHIAAALLYCVDTFGQEKTHIVPAARPAEDSEQADEGDGADEPVRPGDDPSGVGSADAPVDLTGRQQQVRLQVRRRSRSKTRDFLSRVDHVIRLVEPGDKRIIRLQVTLHGSRNSATLPWLTFAVGLDSLYPVANVEQFAEAISRDLPLELDKDFTFSPLLHRFTDQDTCLIRMLQDAFENDYKAVFGTSHASSRDRFFTLNASRFAEFLAFSGRLSDCAWQIVKETTRLPIQIRQADLPVSLYLTLLDEHESTDAAPYQLELVCQQPLQQMTASRNVYLVGDVFYIPPHDSIRLLEPILSTFTAPGCRFLTLTRDEAILLVSAIGPRLQDTCPLQLHADLSRNLIQEPLLSRIDLDCTATDLKADLTWQYGPLAVSPVNGKNKEIHADPLTLVVRDFAQEEHLLRVLAEQGFTQQGAIWRLSDPDKIYRFLNAALPELRQIAEVHLSEAAARLRVLPPPQVAIHFSWLEDQDNLLLRQSFGDLGSDELLPYLQALRERKPYLRNRDGSFRQIDPGQRDLLLRLFDLLHLWQIEPGTPESLLPRYRALVLENLLQTSSGTDTSALICTDEKIRELARHLREPGSLSFRIPAAIRTWLRPYQKTGVHWLCTLDYYGLGGILADDMGLGKTLQTIAYVHMMWQKKKKTALIIAPTSLVYNWLGEFAKFSPHLPVRLIDGNRQQRSGLFQEMGQYACVITSYSLLRRDIEDLAGFAFGSCFLDEAQNIKNPETLNARSVKQIQAERAFALTGTPIENSLIELWSIFDFVLPGYLHSQRTFQNMYELPIMRDGQTALLADLHQQIAPFVLRRMKRDVLHELPDKIESHTVCDMTEDQRSLYETFLTRSRNDLAQEVDLHGYARSQIYILALLTRLRQICCHPALFLRQYAGGSGKLLLLDELLADSFSAGHRVLVFSQFTSMLEIIRDRQLEQGIRSFTIDGQVPSEERITQVDRFNQGEGKLFLISLRAGGTGLNLTGADTVVHYDPWWNPAVEEQATDRAYRIGQESVVQVFKLFTRQSVEEKILKLQQRKQGLIDAVIKPGQNLLSKMTFDEVMSLFEP
jgi:hypothetical protein